MKERKKERMEERMEGSKGEQILETVGNRQGRKGEGGRGSNIDWEKNRFEVGGKDS